MTAQRSAEARRSRKRKLIRQPDLHAHVVACLKIGWSPEQISGRLRLDNSGISVSHETIYAFVYSREGQSAELARYLPRRRKKRRSRFARRPRGQVFPPERSIHQRPDSVKSRDVFGDWEGDLMIFECANGNMKVASLVERKTRFAVFFVTMIAGPGIFSTNSWI